MTELLSLAFPGFIAVTIYRWFGRSRSRAGWDYLILTGVGGGLAYALARLLALSLADVHQVDWLRRAIDSAFPGRADNGTYLLSFAVAVVLGYGSQRILYCNRVRRLCERMGMQHPPGETDALSQLQVDAERYPVVVSTTLGQVYIGQIEKVTTDPDEEKKILVMRVFAGGSRIDQTVDGQAVRRVKYNYVIDQKLRPSRLSYLDVDNVVSISQFGLPEFEQTRASEYSQISDSDFETLFANLAAAFHGFAEAAEQYYAEEEQRLTTELAESDPDRGI